jgi:hypothetical protein
MLFETVVNSFMQQVLAEAYAEGIFVAGTHVWAELSST